MLNVTRQLTLLHATSAIQRTQKKKTLQLRGALSSPELFSIVSWRGRLFGLSGERYK